MQHSVTRFPSFLSTTAGSKSQHDWESIVASNDIAVRYLRKQQVGIASVVATSALRDSKKLPVTIQGQELARQRNKPLSLKKTQILFHGTVTQKGVIIRDSELAMCPQSVKLALLYNLGLIQQLQANSAEQFSQAICTYKEALKAIPDVSCQASNNTSLNVVHVAIWNNLAICYAEFANGDQVYQCKQRALDILRSSDGEESPEDSTVLDWKGNEVAKAA